MAKGELDTFKGMTLEKLLSIKGLVYGDVVNFARDIRRWARENNWKPRRKKKGAQNGSKRKRPL
jgi:hypothetical protein